MVRPTNFDTNPSVSNLHLSAVSQIITSAGHSGQCKVEFKLSNNSIKIHPDSTLMTMLSSTALKFLLWILLVYPFLWLYRRYGSAGGKWDVCRATFICRRDPRNPPGVDGVPLRSDGDLVQIWERTIRLAVRDRIQTTRPIYRPTANNSEVIIYD
jgi:hypothetical protein